LKKYKKEGFVGVYSINDLDKIPVNASADSINFVMNTVPSNVKYGHWVAVYINKHNLEYYDSFGQPPSNEFITNIKAVLKKFVGNKPLQFKINRIKIQSVSSTNCGYYAIKFLIDKYQGKSFKEITKYNKLMGVFKSEKQIEAFKKKINIKPFEYINAE
jgi:hypothetical protein